MNQYIPHTQQDRDKMMQAIGISSTDELFSCIPASVLLKDSVSVGRPHSEEEVVRLLKALSEKNKKGISFLGAGSYDHIIPSTVKAIASLPSFVTAYTPYQPEISQGVLQVIYEYQTMICELTGMDVSNASLYDGASAMAEAAALAISNRRKSNEIIISDTVHPFAIECVKTWAKGRGHVVHVVESCNGVSDLEKIKGLVNDSTAVVMVQSPNRYGILEDFTGLSDAVHAGGALLAISSDPLSLALQKSQAEWGADIATGDTQVLGIPCGFGGPYCGYMAVTSALMRKIPGRIVGKTVDTHGDTCYVLTLQAREQHIKRERATSNICSNEALMALTSAVHLSVLGWNGVKEAANQSYVKAHYLADALTKCGYNLSFPDKPFWCEFAVSFSDEAALERFVASQKKSGIFAGVRLAKLTGKAKDANTLLIAVTEKRTIDEINLYIANAKEVC